MNSERPTATELLLETWVRLTDQEDIRSVIYQLEAAASLLFDAPCRILMAGEETPAESCVAIWSTERSEILAHLIVPTPLHDWASLHWEVFCRMAGWALNRVSLLRAARERQNLIHSVTFARRILEESLPATNLIHRDWEISGCLRPALHLGGDLFSYSATSGHMRFLLGDAVGHGLDSTLLVSECRALWRGLAREGNLELEVTRLSQLLYENTGAERFVAAIMGHCSDDGDIDYVACGQGPVFILRAQEIDVLEDPDPPLGLFPDQQFEVRRVHLEPGDCMFCTTDGVLELEDSQGLGFSPDPLLEALRARPISTAQEIVDGVFRAMDVFCKPETPRDDACALAILRRHSKL